MKLNILKGQIGGGWATHTKQAVARKREAEKITPSTKLNRRRGRARERSPTSQVKDKQRERERTRESPMERDTRQARESEAEEADETDRQTETLLGQSEGRR